MNGVAIRSSPMGRFRPKMDAVKVMYFFLNHYLQLLLGKGSFDEEKKLGGSSEEIIIFKSCFSKHVLNHLDLQRIFFTSGVPHVTTET